MGLSILFFFAESKNARTESGPQLGRCNRRLNKKQNGWWEFIHKAYRSDFYCIAQQTSAARLVNRGEAEEEEIGFFYLCDTHLSVEK